MLKGKKELLYWYFWPIIASCYRNWVSCGQLIWCACDLYMTKIISPQIQRYQSLVLLSRQPCVSVRPKLLLLPLQPAYPSLHQNLATKKQHYQWNPDKTKCQGREKIIVFKCTGILNSWSIHFTTTRAKDVIHYTRVTCTLYISSQCWTVTVLSHNKLMLAGNTGTKGRRRKENRRWGLFYSCRSNIRNM